MWWVEGEGRPNKNRMTQEKKTYYAKGRKPSPPSLPFNPSQTEARWLAKDKGNGNPACPEI